MQNSGQRRRESMVLFGIEADGCMATGQESIRSHFGTFFSKFLVGGALLKNSVVTFI